VPREWTGRCFVLCTGESLKAQAHLVPRLKGRIIAVKHAVLLRPDADVLFLSGEGCAAVARELIPKFTGQYVIVRGKSDPSIPSHVKRVTRTKDHDRLCDLPDHVMGRDTGTSAIDLAYHFGATEIILMGFDMQGGHYCAHPLPRPPESHFRRHMEVLPKMAADAKARGIRIVNCSPASRVECFEKQPLEMFL
jgi:hypothetical protein